MMARYVRPFNLGKWTKRELSVLGILRYLCTLTLQIAANLLRNRNYQHHTHIREKKKKESKNLSRDDEDVAEDDVLEKEAEET